MHDRHIKTHKQTVLSDGDAQLVAIYVFNQRLISVSRHSDYGGPEHSILVHRKSDRYSIITESAFIAMKQKVQLGRAPFEAYNDCALENPSKAPHLLYTSLTRKLHVERSHYYPAIPKQIQDVNHILKSNANAGWTLNYWGH